MSGGVFYAETDRLHSDSFVNHGRGILYGVEQQQYLEKLMYIRHILELIQGEIEYSGAPLFEVLEKLQTGCRSLIAAGCWISKEGWRQEAGRVFGGSGRRARKQN